MKRYSLFVLVLSLLLSTSTKAEVTTIKTYIIAGQSNANGYGLGSGDLFSGTLLPNQTLSDIERDDLAVSQSSAYIFKGSDDSGLGEWNTMAPGFGTWNGRRFGAELSFSKQFHSHTGAQVAIIKYSPDNTSLYSDWKPDDIEMNPYDYFLNTVNNAKAAALLRDWSLEISGVLWMQGESDAFGVDAPTAYEQNLGYFIDKVREDLSLPNLAFHIGQIADTDTWPARQKIWDAQSSVAARDNNTHLVNAKDLPLFTNDGIDLQNTHYTTEGIVILGERFASSVINTETIPLYPESTEDMATTEKNKPTTIDILANDIGSRLSITDVNRYSASGGTVNVVNGKVVYTPKLDFIGEDTFWYILSDYLGRTNSTKVTIDVTRPITGAYPQGNPDTATTVVGHVVAIDVLANDTGTDLTFTELNPWSLHGGRVAIVDNKISYTPDPNFSGEDKIWYAFKDPFNRTNNAEVTITVLKTAPYPVAITETVTVIQNTAKTFDALANDIGVDLSLTTVNDYSANGGRVTISDGKIRYTPKANYIGDDSFWYVIQDYLERTNAIKVTINIHE